LDSRSKNKKPLRHPVKRFFVSNPAPSTHARKSIREKSLRGGQTSTKSSCGGLTSTDLVDNISLMRKDSFEVGDYIHVYNRGNRKMDIVKDEIDHWRFLANLRYFNDEKPGEFIMRSIINEKSRNKDHNLLNGAWRSNLHEFEWPKSIAAQKPIVKIVAYCLMPNHYHLLLQEIIDGGVTAYMRKLGTGFTYYINVKYGEVGKLFQGSYKARLITDENYLQYVDAYIQVLNPFELLANGLPLNNFDEAFKMVIDSPLSSLGESLGIRDFHITDRKSINKEFHLPDTLENYKKLAKEATFDQGVTKFLEDLKLAD